MIQHIILISTVTVGIHLAIMELLFTFIEPPENIFLGLKKWQQHLCKPLFYCPTCMASFWGTIWHFYFGGSLLTWIPVVLAVSFFNTLFAKWVSN